MALADKVTAWCKLDEASGNRVNFHTTGASYDLQDINTVTSDEGKIGNAAVFLRANLERLSNANDVYKCADDFAFLLWVHNINSDGAVETRAIATKFASLISDRELDFYSVPSAPSITLRVSTNDSGSLGQLVVSTVGLHSDADPGWDCIAFGRRTSPSDQLWIRINDAAIQTANAAGPAYTGGTYPFVLGGRPGSGATNFFTGRLDEFVFCAAGVVEADIDEYWNGGDGVSYEAIFGGVPDDPTGLAVTSTSPTTANLSWNDESDDETGFIVERGTDGVNFSEIETTAADVETYTDTGLTSGARYYYRVKATNANGDSGYTDVVSVVTLFGPVTSMFAQQRVTSTFAQQEVTSTFAQEEITSVFRRL
jgi:hypothetical protein